MLLVGIHLALLRVHRILAVVVLVVLQAQLQERPAEPRIWGVPAVDRLLQTVQLILVLVAVVYLVVRPVAPVGVVL